MAKRFIATLVRGSSYTIRRIKFEREKPREVDADLAEELRKIVTEVRDSEGDVRIKASFKITEHEEELEKVELGRKKLVRRDPDDTEPVSSGVKPRAKTLIRKGG